MTKMILFDVDGVLLSEERYFDASALTVSELIHSKTYLGLDASTFTPSPPEETIRRVRKQVFADDQALNLIKKRGINANWDMVYITFSYQLICFLEQLQKYEPGFVENFLANDIDHKALKALNKKMSAENIKTNYSSFTESYEKSDVTKQALINYLNKIAEEKTGVKTTAFSRSSPLWDVCQEAFQEWYLGDEKVELSIGKPPLQTGKKGFLNDEIPIVEPKQMKHLFQELKEKGVTLGIGTGRPEIETIEPLRSLGVLEWFDQNRIVTASDVLKVERQYPEHAPLAKPQPFSYVYGRIGKNRPEKEAIDHPLPIKNANELLVVGDSVADFLAAKSIGCQFAAVLTGLSGQKARSQFEELEADYILNDVTEVADIF
jgi:phosphoglycolate phosphatase-like HAD superfamily hydrolase